MTHFHVRTLEECEGPGPAQLLLALPRASRPVLLDSSDGSGWTLLAWDPDRELNWCAVPAGVTSNGAGSPAARWPLAAGDPGLVLEEACAGESWEREEDGPQLAGGWIGYLGFECGHAWEPYPWTRRAAHGLPDFAFARYRQAVAWDPRGRLHLLWAEALDQAGAARERRAVESVFRGLLDAAPAVDGSVPAFELVSRTGPAQYQAGVRRLRQWIGAGELFQANLSHCLEGVAPAAPREIYAGLRTLQPTGMSAYWEDGRGRAVLSSSPERFLSVCGDRLETRPVKGTAARTGDADLDLRAAAALARSEKEVAELTMIVDMARHDLGRVAVPGSVEVPSAGTVEPYPTLFHRAATVRARREPGAGFAALMRAAFPPASVSGAPKVRALQAIAELEGEARGPYCGALGYWEPGTPRGDFAVLIRSAVVSGGHLSLRVGAGIVWDSDPQLEWEETMCKARYFFDAARPRRSPAEARA